MSDLTVNPWKRHGKDRLYVNLPDGTTVAWADRLTKVITIKVVKYRDEAVVLLRKHLGDSVSVRSEKPRPRAAAESPIVTPPRQPADTSPSRRRQPVALPELTVADDLAENRPGAVVLETIAARGPSVLKRFWTRALRRSSEWDSWYLGLEGERRVGRELQRLSASGWKALHGVPKANGGDIDHLLIGPGGVFTINTKHHQNASVWVGDTMAKVNRGQPVPYAAASQAEASYAQEVLERHCGFPVPVEPVLVFVGVASLQRAVTQYAVRIYQEREVSALAPLSGKLTAEQIERAYSVARHRRAWLRG
jgi:hypothetical protein